MHGFRHLKQIPMWVFPSCLIALNLLSGTVYFVNGKFFKGIYWFSAAILTFTVTFDEKQVWESLLFLAQKVTKGYSF